MERKPTLGEQIVTLEGRASNLEKGVQGAFENVDKALNEQKRVITNLVDTIMCILNVKGEDFQKKVESEIKIISQKRMQDETDRAKKVLDEMVSSGKYAASDTVNGDCVIVGCERDKDGNVLRVGREQLHISSLSENIQTALMGQSVGFVFKDENGGNSFEITELYSPVQQPTPPTEEVKAQ